MGTRCEYLSPSAADVGQRDDVSISGRRIPKIGDEGKDFGGDPADWGELVPQESNQVEDLESVPLEII